MSGQFGHEEVTLHSVTYGLNERGGMNAVELDKYIEKNLLPLYPDIEDKPLKRVLVKVDSGPGRTNVTMLAGLRLRGLYMVPGVPNTTGATQETDQNYGPFKMAYRSNLRTLTNSRFARKMTLSINDLPLLVFGGKDVLSKCTLANAFKEGFSEKQCLSAWKKCGAVPLTSAPLLNPSIRHEIVLDGKGTNGINTSLDPHSERLRKLGDANYMHCFYLSSFGFDGKQFRITAPTSVAKKFELTQPHSKERIVMLQKAKTAGQLFHATHGEHFNSTDFFHARAKTERDKVIKKLEKRKLREAELLSARDAAAAIVLAKGEPTMDTLKAYKKEEIEILHKWKLGRKAYGKKTDNLQAYTDAPAPPKLAGWTTEDENKLLRLNNDAIQFKDTALAVALKQKANAVSNNIGQLDENDAKKLMSALINRTNNNPEDSDEQDNIV